MRPAQARPTDGAAVLAAVKARPGNAGGALRTKCWPALTAPARGGTRDLWSGRKPGSQLIQSRLANLLPQSARVGQFLPERVITRRSDSKSRRLFIVRHCQLEANRDQLAEARGDSGLTETGIKQAQLRASHLRSVGIAGETVVSSSVVQASLVRRLAR
jgi:hypothetical protein